MLKLSKQGDILFAETDDLEEAVPVILVYARPVSNRTGEISVYHAEDKGEVAWLDSLDELNAENRALAEAALRERYPICIIEAVTDSMVNHGHRFLKVETDRGFRYFNLKELGKNVTYLGPDRDHVVIRDSMGNRYEIPSIRALDPDSREKLEIVM